MTRARDIANFAGNPPLTKDLGTSLVSAGTVSSSTVVANPPNAVQLWDDAAMLNSVTSVSLPTTETFEASFEDYTYFSWSSHSFWTDFSAAIGTVGNMTQMRIDQGGGTVHDYDVVTDYFSYAGEGEFAFTWRAYWYVGGTWNGTTGTLPAGTAGDPHPTSNMGTYIVSWLQSNDQDRVTSTDSNAATILAGQDKFMVGSTVYNVADVTLSGADITWPDSTGRTFNNGDTIGYYDSPDSITGTLNDGSTITMEFDSTDSTSGFLIDGNPVQGLEVNYYSNPKNMSGATDAGINQGYGGGTVSVNIDGENAQGFVTSPSYILPRPNPSPKGKFLIQGEANISLSNNNENWEYLEGAVFIEIKLVGHPKSSGFMVPPMFGTSLMPSSTSCARFFARAKTGSRDIGRQQSQRNFFQWLVTDAPAVDLEFRVVGYSSHLPANTAGTYNSHQFQITNLRIIEL